MLSAAGVYYSSLGSRTLRALCPPWMGPNRQQPSWMVGYGKPSLSAYVGPFLFPVRKFRNLYFFVSLAIPLYPQGLYLSINPKKRKKRAFHDNFNGVSF